MKNGTTMLHYQIFIIGLSLAMIVTSLLFRLTSFLPVDLPLIIAIILGGVPALTQIFLKMLKRDLGADLLAVIAIITAVVIHEYLAAVIIVLMLASGQALEAYSMRKASSVLLALADRMPNIVHKKTLNNIVDIPLVDVKIDDVIVIYPHETCPADGIVIEGQGSMNEAYLTGEPYRISKIPGTSVISGAINGETVLMMKVERIPAESRYAAIVKVLEDAQQKKPTLRRLGDNIGAIFAPLALVFALIAWYVSGDSVRFLAVLVIATPCPLLIAIPITIISAISLAAKHGIIIKDPTVLERLPTCRTAIFDKTGTLTYGRPVLSKIHNHSDMPANDILQYVASIARYSKHPLSQAIVKAAQKQSLPFLNTTSIMEPAGLGLTGIIDNNKIYITNRKYITEKFPDYVKELPQIVTGLECLVLMNDEYIATFQFQDMPRKESKLFISHLKPIHQFDKIMLVSGDRKSEVDYLGKLLDVTELYASQTPEQKLEIVKSEMKKNATLFMGDGINDAPALSVVTVGIAFGQFSNVTSEAAGVVIMNNSLSKVDQLIHLSIATRQIALQSALGGMFLSTIGMGFAAAGFITPVIGAILQEVIDVIAILYSLRLIWNPKIESDLHH